MVTSAEVRSSSAAEGAQPSDQRDPEWYIQLAKTYPIPPGDLLEYKQRDFTNFRMILENLVREIDQGASLEELVRIATYGPDTAKTQVKFPLYIRPAAIETFVTQLHKRFARKHQG